MNATLTVAELAPRHVAVLRAVAAGRAELTASCEPDLYVDGRCCTDHTVAGLLTRAGLITPKNDPAARAAGRVAARLTEAGRACLRTETEHPEGINSNEHRTAAGQGRSAAGEGSAGPCSTTALRDQAIPGRQRRRPGRGTAAAADLPVAPPLTASDTTPQPGGSTRQDRPRRAGSPNTHEASGENPMVRTDNPDCLWLGCDWDWGTEPCGCGRAHTFRICARCLTADDPVCPAAGRDGSGVAA